MLLFRSAKKVRLVLTSNNPTPRLSMISGSAVSGAPETAAGLWAPAASSSPASDGADYTENVGPRGHALGELHVGLVMRQVLPAGEESYVRSARFGSVVADRAS